MAALTAFALLTLLHFSLGKSLPSPDFKCSDTVESDTGDYPYRPNGDLPQIYETLINCPNTTSLSLIYYASGERRQTEPVNFKFIEGRPFPAIRELSIQGYDFGDYRVFRLLREEPSHDWAKTPMKPMLLEEAEDNYLPSSQAIYIPGANIDTWKKAMDWRELRSLTLAQIDNIFFWKMKGRLPALTNLTIRDNYGRSNVSEYMTDFLTALNPLTNLSTHGYTSSVDWSRVLEKHGDTLEHLAITDWNIIESTDAVQTLSVNQLEDISHQCPNLKSFSVKVNIGTGVSEELLKTLASFASVPKLSIWLRGNQESVGIQRQTIQWDMRMSWSRPTRIQSLDSHSLILRIFCDSSTSLDSERQASSCSNWKRRLEITTTATIPTDMMWIGTTNLSRYRVSMCVTSSTRMVRGSKRVKHGVIAREHAKEGIGGEDYYESSYQGNLLAVES